MKFPNAAAGIKKIFTAEILDLIAVLLGGISLIFSVAFVASIGAESEVGLGVSTAGFAVFAVAAAVISIIALILNIVGYLQTAKDEQSFKTIVYLTIFSIIIAFIAAFFSGNQYVQSITTGIVQAISLISSILVIFGISNLATQLKRQDVVDKCTNIFKVIILVGLVSLIAKFISMMLQNQVGAVIAIVLAVIAMIFSLVQYILYLSLLAKAKKMLNE